MWSRLGDYRIRVLRGLRIFFASAIIPAQPTAVATKKLEFLRKSADSEGLLRGTWLALKPVESKENSVRHTLTALILVTALSAARIASAQTPAQVEHGQKVFAAQKCSVCHSVAALGNKKGPLDGVGAKLSADVIRQWIVDAPAMAAKAKTERKPPMKAYATLPKEELDALVAYLQSLKKP